MAETWTHKVTEWQILTNENRYIIVRDETCMFNKPSVAATVVGGVEISHNETKMAQWLLKDGPISVGVNSNAMRFYYGGISHPWSFFCSPESEGIYLVIFLGSGYFSFSFVFLI